MPVVVNEFEVVPDTASPQGGNAPPEPASKPAPAVDVDVYLSTRRARARRVRVY